MLSYRPDKATVAWFFVLLISIDVFVAFLRMCPPAEPQQAAECAEKYYGLTQTLAYWVFGGFVFWIKHNEGLVTAAATVAIAWFTLTLKKSTDNLFIATNKTADAAQKSADGLMDAERPHMVPSIINIKGLKNLPDAEGNVILNCIVRSTNYGKSPAIMQSMCVMCDADKELAPIPKYNNIQRTRFIIAPGSWYGSIKQDEIVVPKSDADNIAAGTSSLWIYLKLEYTDAFRRPHISRGAYKVIFDGNGNSSRFYPDGPDSYWEYT